MIRKRVPGGKVNWGMPALFAVIIAWLLVSLVSLNHLLGFSEILVFSSTLLGLVGWTTIFLTIAYFSRTCWRQVLCIFLLFFCFGYWRGPFLEPPSDPFEHLRRINEYCSVPMKQIPQSNMGLWHYSMAGVMLCADGEAMTAEAKLQRIDFFQGAFLGISMCILFLVGKSAKLEDRWAILACLIALLFMGTNRFSYFTYYSFAPSATSLFLYWGWIGLFFFQRNRQSLVTGVITAILSLPILWVNHQQEAVFMGFIVVVWLLLNAAFWLFSKRGETFVLRLGDSMRICISRKQMRSFFVFFLVLLLFVLPQFPFFREYLSRFMVRDLWERNQSIAVGWYGLHLWGRVWTHRVYDTLGFVSILMSVAAVPYFWPGFIRKSFEHKMKVFILGILPFLGYCIPLFHFIWLSNVRAHVYYRLCYTSLFWLFLAYTLQGFEGRVYIAGRKVRALLQQR